MHSPAGDRSADKELGSVGVRSSIGHGQCPWFSVIQFEVLVGELLPVDAPSASTVVVGEVAALTHEVRNDTMESALPEALSFRPLA